MGVGERRGTFSSVGSERRAQREIEWITTDPPAPQPRRNKTPKRRRDRKSVVRLVGVGVIAALTVVAIISWWQRDGSESGRAERTRPPIVVSSVTVSGSTPKTSVDDLEFREVIDKGAPLLPAPAMLEVIVHTVNSIVRIDVDRGRIVRTPVPRISSTAPTFVVAGATSVLVRPYDNVPGYVVPDDGWPALTTGLLAPGTYGTYAGPSADQAWVLGHDGKGNRLWLVHFDGRAAGEEIALPQLSAWGSDGAGGIVIAGQSGAYYVGTNGLSRITEGEILAAGPNAWLIRECEGAACRTAVIDRTTSSRRNMRFSIAGDFQRGGSVSPDGRFAALVSKAQPYALTLLDLTSGEQGPTLATSTSYWLDFSDLAWSPDSRFLFFTDSRSTLKYYDRVTNQVAPLAVEFQGIESFTTRPTV